ncbi:dentin sialophosphoprotein-like [Dorcoceras hygrometricum]|uniref:Dentin sialophosphoprotein-like n=1 Tax=Dorcoceras hygrometricum TaxID=472368 RepID=A0A2Z7BXE2_9LAMI|nr:dentin sialophosphoprotein-like [Dorcoceras hygrometricum]
MMAMNNVGNQGTTTQLCNQISIINQNPNHSDSAGYRDLATTLDSQHDDSAGKWRLNDYHIVREHSSNSSCKSTALPSHSELNKTARTNEYQCYSRSQLSSDLSTTPDLTSLRYTSSRNQTTSHRSPAQNKQITRIQRTSQLLDPTDHASQLQQPTSKLMSPNDVASSPARDKQIVLPPVRAPVSRRYFKRSKLFRSLAARARDCRTDHALDSLHTLVDTVRSIPLNFDCRSLADQIWTRENCIDRLPAQFLFFRCLAGRRDPDPPWFPYTEHWTKSERCGNISSVELTDCTRSVDAKTSYFGWIQLAVGPQPLWLRNHNFGLAQRIMVKRLATSPHDPLGITDSACKNQLVVVSVQYGPFNPYIPIRSTTIGKSRVARDPIAMHTSWRSNSDIASVTSIGYPRMRAIGESSTTKHRLLHASGSHPIPPPNDPKFSSFAKKRFKVFFKEIPRKVRALLKGRISAGISYCRKALFKTSKS